MAPERIESTPQPNAGQQPGGGTPRVSRRRRALGRLVRLGLKELREILRDRRTVVTLVMMPLLVYPLLSVAFQRFLFSSLQTIDQLQCIVALESDEDGQSLEQFLGLGETILRERGELEEPVLPQGGAALAGGPRPANAEPEMVWITGTNLRNRVADGTIDVAVIVRKPPSANTPRPTRRRILCELVYREGSVISEAGVRYIERRLRVVNDQFTRELLANIPGRPALPTGVTRRGIVAEETAFSLTTLVPLILILMTITGAVYPAIDLTAGERERGTLETLMAAPVPRLGLLVAKYVAVLTVALFTATANLFAMTVTLLATGLAPLVFGQGGLSPTLISQVFALLILFAAFFSAILLALTSFARSFKEAQAYLIPVMLLSLAPGMISLMPNLEFNGLLAVTPLVNIVLLARDILEGTVNPPLATAAVLSTALYAVAAITLAARIFGTDAILYGSSATWSDLFRRPAQARHAATVTGAMFCLAVLFPSYFLLSNLLQQFSTAGMTVRLALAATVTIGLFVVLPLCLAVAQKIDLRSGFQLRPAGLFSFFAAAVLGITLWPLAHEVFLLNQAIGLGSLRAEQMKAVQEMLDQWRLISPLVIVLTLAVTPAVCEEFFFRGYLLTALRKRLRPVTAILASAVLFGLFHVITTSMLSTERFLPSTLIGLLLGWVCVRTGSVLPGMLLHACHNGLLLMIAYYRDFLLASGFGVEQQRHMPAAWLAAAASGLVVGIVLLLVATRAGNSAPENTEIGQQVVNT